MTDGCPTLDIDDAELALAESAVLAALDSRNVDGLKVLGFGETTLALAWPTDAPRLVLKRMISTPSASDAAEISASLSTYIERIGEHVRVAPTEVRTILTDGGRHVIYLVQQLFDPSVLVDTVLAASTPSSDNPIVSALIDVVLSATQTNDVGVDAQFSNFAWVDSELVLFDVGTPFLFESDGSLALDPRHMVSPLPMPVRAKAATQINGILRDMTTRRGSFFHSALGLARVGLDDWLDPVLAAFAPHVEPAITEQEVREHVASRHKESLRLKQLMRAQRVWIEKVRRRRYDVFITDSFTGELL